MKAGSIISNTIVTLICVGAAVVAFWYFWLDLNGTLTKLDEKPVAAVLVKDKVVQRHFSDRLVWDQLRTDSPVYQGDVVRTADLSGVMMIFINDDSVSMGENTMIQLFYGEQGLEVNVSVGSVTAHSGGGEQNLVLVSGENHVEVAPGGVVTSNTAADGAFALQVTEGMVMFVSGGTEEMVRGGDAFTVSASGQVRAASRVVLLEPSDGTAILGSGDFLLEQNFSWNRMNIAPGETIRLEIAHDRRFNQIAGTVDVRGTDGEAVRLPVGTYWWRAYPVGEREAVQFAAVNRFVLEREEIAVPEELAALEAVDARQPGAVEPESAQPSTENDETPARTETAEPAGRPETSNAEPEDERPVDRGRAAESSSVEEVPPRITSPLVLSRVTGNFVEGGRTTPALRWTSQSPIDRLRVIIWREGEGGRPSLGPLGAGASSAGGEVILPDLAAGNYRWTVEARTPEGDDISAAGSSTFRIAPIPPLSAPGNLRPVRNTRIGRAEILNSRRLTLSWNAVSGANAYVVTIRKADQELFVQSPPQRTLRYVIPDVIALGAGTVNWQVEALSLSDNNTVRRLSPPARSSFVIAVSAPQSTELVE